MASLSMIRQLGVLKMGLNIYGSLKFGNYIQALLNALNYCLNDGIKELSFEQISFDGRLLLNKSKIYIDVDLEKDNSQEIFLNIQDCFSNRFPNKKATSFPTTGKKRNLFKKYIGPIFDINFNQQDHFLNDPKKLSIHIRGGDIFSISPHPSYRQPPLDYYLKIMKSYEEVFLIAQDKFNPCVNELLKLNNVHFISSDLKEDLTNLVCSQNVVLGYGTFGMIPLYCSINLKNIYFPDYFITQESLEKNFKNYPCDINFHCLSIPDYIKKGEWQNTEEQRSFMLNYRLPYQI